MKKTFLFDMDGVLVNSEPVWERDEPDFLRDLFGSDIYEKVKDIVLGSTVERILDHARVQGFEMANEEFFTKYDAAAHRVYPKAEMTEGIDEFGEFLIEKGFLLGLVSSSRKNWIDLVIPRLSFGEKFETIISVNDDPDLQSKPAPDGYKKAMELIGTTPENTIILEDSNTGIEAGQTSGALTIGLRQNLPEGYVQKGADLYAENLESLKKILSVF